MQYEEELVPIEDIFTLEPDEPVEPVLVPEPTNAPLGSPDRVRVMADRFERGECLYNPRDVATCLDMPVPISGETYTNLIPGLNLRVRGNGQQDWYISTFVFGLQIVRRYDITKRDEAVKFLEDAHQGILPGLVEKVKELSI